MWSDGGRIPRGLGSVLLGALACGLVGAIVARHALVGFAEANQQAVAGTVGAGLSLAGLWWLRRGLRCLCYETFGRLE